MPRGRPVAGQLSDTPLCAGLTHFTLCVPVFEFQGSITFPLSSSPAGTSSWNRTPTATRPNAGDRPCSRAALSPLLKGESLASTSVCVECLCFQVTGVKSLTGLLGVRQKEGLPQCERNHIRINVTRINVAMIQDTSQACLEMKSTRPVGP